ncbi:actin interacting protein 3-domain-containing protein, partial [Delphinella strobiligena]
QSAPQQLSTIEKSVTHLLVATKQLLETLTQWSRGAVSEGEVSDVYVRLGYEFNIACRAFNSIGVDTGDLGPVPDLLRGILEETLSQEASQSSLDRFLPRIRDIIINLLHGLKKKQQRLRQRATSGSGQSSRQASVNSNISLDSALLNAEADANRPSSSRSYAGRVGSGDHNGHDLPPRSTSVQGGRTSPRKEGFSPNNSLSRAARELSRDTFNSDSSSISSNAMQNMPVIAPYPQEETMPPQPPPPPHDPNANNLPQPPQITEPPRTYYSEETLPPPPPPPKQQDALAALQRGGELERRASRRFSAYQISKHLGSTNGVPMLPPAQNSPVPNRGRDTRESMTAVRTRSIYQHNRQKSSNPRILTDSPRRERPSDRRISEEPGEPAPSNLLKEDAGTPIIKTPEDKLASYPFPSVESNDPNGMAATINGPMGDPILEGGAEPTETNGIHRHQSNLSRDNAKRQTTTQQSTSQPQFVPESSPQPGKELTLFLQYKSKIKKFVLPDGGDLSIPRLQLAFIEKFAWNTHSNGNDLPEIYLQDPVSGVRHELEDLTDIKDRAVLVLNVEQLDEVKRHFDDGLSGIRTLIEGLRTSVVGQQSAIQRVSDKQQEAAKEIASLAAAPRATAVSGLATGAQGTPSGKIASTQLDEVQSLRRDLAVVRQTYTSFVDDINSSMSAIRSKAASVKTVAEESRAPSLNAETGRTYVNAGKQAVQDESESLLTRVDDLQDVVEDLRKDVITRGVRPLPRQLDAVSKDISAARTALKKLQEYLKREKPVWTKIWEKELQAVCNDRDLLTMQEELSLDLEDDLEKATATFALVEQVTRQQNIDNAPKGGRVPSRTLIPVALDQGADPLKAKDGVLGEVRALQPNHESRLEAIQRAEKARKKELESRSGGEFQKELGSFVEEGKLKKTGGADEIERQRLLKDERARKENWETQQKRAQEKAAKLAAKAKAEAAARENPAPEVPKAEPETVDSVPVEASETTAEQAGGDTATELAEEPVEQAIPPSVASVIESMNNGETEEPEKEAEQGTNDESEQGMKEEPEQETKEKSEHEAKEEPHKDGAPPTNEDLATESKHEDDKLEVPAAEASLGDLASPGEEAEFVEARSQPPTPAAE